jgi:hypothetical protein
VITALVPPSAQPRTFALNDRDQAAVSIALGPAYGYSADALGFGVDVKLPGAAMSNYSGPGRHYAYVAGINDSGTVVGTEQRALSRAFLSSATGGAVDLGAITGDLDAYDINNAGDVLLEGHVLRRGRLAAIAIAEAGWRLLTVGKMNDAGQVIGAATDAAGLTHAVLLTPLP